MLLPSFEFTDAYRHTYPELPFGLAIAHDVYQNRLSLTLEEIRERALATIQTNREVIRRVIDCYAAFFTAHQQICPLISQFQQVLDKGLPKFAPLVDLLLLTEMSTGVLMGLQDLEHIRGKLVCDLATAGESFFGLRKTLRCHQGEIVLRDEESIVASYFQGPDKRTSLSPATKNLIIYGFFAPGIVPDTVRSALEQAILPLQPISRFTDTYIYTSN